MLFAPRSSFDRLRLSMPSIAALNIRDFATRTSPQQIKQGMSATTAWLTRLPSLDRFDCVICDNLPEILAVRPDARICAQFFWHDVIGERVTYYGKLCDALLAQHKPTVFGCQNFSMEAVRRQPGFTPVGLYECPELVKVLESRPMSQRADLLVTGGTTAVIQKSLRKVIFKLIESGPGIYERIHVDHELLPSDPPSWMIKADFSAAMFCRLRDAICRPGLGVVTDLITAGVGIYPIFEEGNREMSNNAKVIEDLGLSISFPSLLR